jgi:hypothetical protein
MYKPFVVCDMHICITRCLHNNTYKIYQEVYYIIQQSNQTKALEIAINPHHALHKQNVSITTFVHKQITTHFIQVVKVFSKIL